MPRQPYPYDVTDAEWTLLEPLVPAPLPGGRPPRHPRREIVNAILYALRTGCPWRALPHDLPPWGTVWWYFRQWREAGVWETVTTALREEARVRVGREPTPSAAILDSQSAKTTEKGGRAATTRATRSPGASATSSSTPRAFCSKPTSIRPT
jgi:transposase